MNSLKKLLIFVDESNITAAAISRRKNLDWLRLREYLVKQSQGDSLIEMVVFIGLPPLMEEWKEEREKREKFIYWLRSNGFLVYTKDGSPKDENHYKSNVDVLMAIESVELSINTCPDVVILVTGDGDFSHLCLNLRRRGITVEVAAVEEMRSNSLKASVNRMIDLEPFFLGLKDFRN